MKTFPLLRKYSYLLRMSFTLLAAFCAFIIGTSYIMLTSSYRAMVQQNEDFYRQTTASYMAYFSNRLAEMRTNAVIIVRSDTPLAQNEACHMTREVIESSPYYAYCAVNLLKDYRTGMNGVSGIGIYYKDTDYVLTSSSQYALSDFLTVYAGADETQRDALYRFLSNTGEGVHLFSTFSSESIETGKLLVGYRVKNEIGDEAVVFFVLRRGAIDTSFFATHSAMVMNFYIFAENGTLLYASSMPDERLAEAMISRSALPCDTGVLKLPVSQNYAAYCVGNTVSELNFVSVVNRDAPEMSLLKFYSISQRNLLLLLGMFLCLLLISVIVNYKPIGRLISGMRSRGIEVNGGEITSILHALDDMEGTVDEQRMLLQEYVFNKLLTGVALSDDERRLLDADDENTYCVYLIPGLRLHQEERRRLTHALEIRGGGRVFITDALHDNHLILVVIGETTNQVTYVELVEEYLHEAFSQKYDIKAGLTVKELGSLHRSYVYAQTSPDFYANLEEKRDLHVIGKDTYGEAILYLLQSVQEGAAAKVVDCLSELEATVYASPDSERCRMYMCYELLISVMNSMRALEMSPSIEEEAALLEFTDISQLILQLKKWLGRACSTFAYKRDETYNDLRYKILDYINEHYVEPTLCRTAIADQFGISVYSFSRIFKETTGIGFREFVNAKRLERSMELLLATSKSVSEIAGELGFLSADYFTKLFRINYNMTPTQFRNNALRSQVNLKNSVTFPQKPR